VTTVVIVVPVLNRPHRVAPLIESIEKATPEPHRTLFVANDDDDTERDALNAAHADVLLVPAARRSWACKINDGIRASTEPWAFAAADDLEFHPDWFSRGDDRPALDAHARRPHLRR
jgi:glycosyltransferase involved in cell wall biosynthesis